MRDFRAERLACSCNFCCCAVRYPQVTVLNGLAEFGRDYKMWLFEVVISAEFNITYTETSRCLGPVR
jgi:hypothetical protein